MKLMNPNLMLASGNNTDTFSSSLTMATEQEPVLHSVDPKSILFSMPTISNDVAEVLPLTQNPKEDELVFHEDEWAQIEFYPGVKLDLIKQILSEYKQFEQSHRVQQYWSEIYVRRIERVSVAKGNNTTA
jgi:hypothetical protein